MFWKIVGLIVSWIGAFVIVNIFGSRFNPVFIVPVFLTLLFIYYRFVKKINFSEMKRGWILAISISCDMGMVVVLCFLLRFLSLPLPLEIIIGLGGITIMVVAGFLLIYFWWARRNLYFTFVPEGRFKTVVRADEVRKILIQWKNHILAAQPSEDGSIDVGDVIEGHTPKRFWGGLRFYGCWPLGDIYIYDFQWTGIKENGELDPHPKEALDFGILKDDVYGCKVEKAEDKRLLPLDIYVALTLRIINPYKALFNVQNWYEAVINRVKPYIRDFITTEEYKDLIIGSIRIGTEIKKRLKEEKILQEFRNRYGIELRQMEVKDIDPGEDYRKATLAEYLAERDKAKVVIGAEAEKERLEKVAQGEAQRIKKVYEQIKEFGDLGKLLRTLETMEKSPGEGSKWIIPLPGVTDLISQVFPGKDLNSLASDDIVKIREIIEKFQQETSKKKAS